MIFLDVGAHEGQTLEEVTDPDRYDWSEIHAFEPMREQWAIADCCYTSGGLHVWNFGLSDRTGWVDMYGQNERMEASIFADKNDVDPDHITRALMVRASEFVTGLGDQLVMKLNCEGAEVPILEDLCHTGAIHQFQAIMIDWDARKIPSIAEHERRIIGRMSEVGFDRYQLCDTVMVGGTHQDRIANWLQGVL
jgi:FkbM family methyltransferase